MSAAVLALSAVAVLAKLDGYMAAAGYDTDHPWRCEIGAALALPTSASITVNALTPDEAHLVAEFRLMNQWARRLLRDLAEGYAVDFPASEFQSNPSHGEVQLPGAAS